MSEELIIKLTDAIARLGAGSIPVEVDLWDADTIAQFLKVSKHQVMQRYAPLPDFPAAARLPAKGGKGHPRWKAAEVIKWAEKYFENRKAA